MRIAFYCPLKPPHHPVPSGDRRMARALMAALEWEGHEVELASAFCSRDGVGDSNRQRRLAGVGAGLAGRLVRHYLARPAEARPRLWFTYHLYHKAPDWLGPPVAEALGVPYVVAEASHAPKQANGPWASGHTAAAAAIAKARLVINLNPGDAACVRPLVVSCDRIVALAPFLDPRPYEKAARVRARHRTALSASLGIDSAPPWLLAVAMMRDGAKVASYRLLGEALAGLGARPWRLLVVGAGAARPRVEDALAKVAQRVHWLGALETDALAPIYAASDLCVWPAVGEAYGMALLEAAAAGLAVVAGRSPGVAQIVADGETGLLVSVGDGPGFGRAVADLVDDDDRRHAMGRAAAERVRRLHGIDRAARILDGALKAVAS